MKNYFFTLIILASFHLLQAQISTAGLEKDLRAQLALLQALDAGIAANTSQSDSLAGLINRLKKPDLSYLERGKMEKWLAESQEMADARQKKLAQRKTLGDQVALLAAQLDQRYAALIDSLVQVACNNADMTARLQAFRAKRHDLLRLLIIPEDPLLGAPVQETTGQMPEEIEARAGLLRDREDKLRQRAGAADARIKQVRQELALRKKMAELLDDVRLFDQRDEAVAVTSKTAREATVDVGSTKGYGGAGEGAQTVEVAAPMERLLQQDVRSLSPEEVEAYLMQLERERQKWLVQADSLERAAVEHDRRALELRNNPRKNP